MPLDRRALHGWRIFYLILRLLQNKPEEKKACVGEEIYKIIPATNPLAPKKTIIGPSVSTSSNLLTGLTIGNLKKLPAYSVLGIAFILIIGGAIGNLIDRILYREVVDFLDFMIGDYHWYIFNLADAAVSVGMVILVIHTMFFTPKQSDTVSSP